MRIITGESRWHIAQWRSGRSVWRRNTRRRSRGGRSPMDEQASKREFQVGDVVQLKSGGPRLTVVELFDDGHVGLMWFLDGGKEGWGRAPTAALDLVSEADHGAELTGILNRIAMEI